VTSWGLNAETRHCILDNGITTVQSLKPLPDNYIDNMVCHIDRFKPAPVNGGAPINITFAAVTNLKFIQFGVKYFECIGAISNVAMFTPEVMNWIRARVIELKALEDKVAVVKPMKPDPLKAL